MTTDTLEVRRVTWDDPATARLRAELTHEYVSRYGEQGRHEMTAYDPALFTPPHGTLLLLLEDGEAVAGGAFKRYDDRTAELKRIWTHSAHRRRGLARRVVAELEAEARRLGYRRLYLTTGPRQPEAKGLYLATGYTPLFDVTADPTTIGPLPFTKDLTWMRTRTLLMLTALLALVVTGCGAPAASPGDGIQPSADVLSALGKDDALAALLPEATRQAGVVKFGSSVGGQPPASYYAEDGKTVLGQDIDIAEAVGKLLGVRVEREVAGFEAILPALTSGKYEVGTGNFGVTEARLKTIDFVTYINDGQGFAVRKDDDRFQKIDSLGQLCGLKIGVGAGTTFEATLEREKHVCTDSGKPAYEVLTFSENAAIFLGLQQRHFDVVMSTINGLRHAAANQPNLKFLNEFKRLDVGFAFKKGSPLTPAFQGAVNKLIKDGTYQRILAKWGTTASAIPESRISPPEHT